jgi:CheY-like chemotaxis protein
MARKTDPSLKFRPFQIVSLPDEMKNVPREQLILLVDDSDDDAFFLTRALDEVGGNLRVERAKHGQEAINYLARAGAATNDGGAFPDLILLDIKMPLCDGFQFLQWKQAQLWLATLRVIVMSSSSLPEDVRLAYQLGAHSYLSKEMGAMFMVERLTLLRRWWFEQCLSAPPVIECRDLENARP